METIPSLSEGSIMHGVLPAKSAQIMLRKLSMPFENRIGSRSKSLKQVNPASRSSARYAVEVRGKKNEDFGMPSSFASWAQYRYSAIARSRVIPHSTNGTCENE